MTELLSKNEKKELLKKVIWDYNIDTDILLDILTGKQKNYCHINRKYLINRCFNYLDWYKFISLFHKSELPEILQIIDDSTDIDYKGKKRSNKGLEFAKKFLRKETLSITG